MKKNTEKKIYILSLINSMDFINSMNGTNDSDVVVTMLTSYGSVVGELNNIDKFQSNTAEELQEELKEWLSSEEKKVNSLSLADWFYNNRFDKEDEEDEEDIEDDVIILKNVTVIKDSGQTFQVSVLSIFASQVIGVVPGAMSITE